MLSPGQRIGAYEIVSLLGAGGMGVVYRARDPRIGREVAIKIFPSWFAESADRLRRFEREARAAGVLNHPNLMTIYDVGSHNDSPFIVSELLEGETLRARLQSGPMPVRKAIDYATQIAQGMAAAHQNGVVHRDLKPENLFVTKDGRVKILDFGIAKLAESAPKRGVTTTVEHETGPGQVLGTAGYMSPEQVRGEEIDARSDIFSFGAVLYEMVSGRRAFKRATTVEIMSAILTDEPADVAATNPNVPPALERIIHHCLEKHPDARFQSARDLAFGLEALKDVSTGARPITRRIANVRRIWIPLVVAALLGVGAIVVVRDHKSPLPSYQRLTFRDGFVTGARFAPDGHSVVYSAVHVPATGEVFTVRPGSPESTSLGLTNAALLAVSPSGEMILRIRQERPSFFRQSGVLARMPLGRGAPREILQRVYDADSDPQGEFAVIRLVNGMYTLEWPIGRTIYRSRGWISHPRISPRGDRVAFLDHIERNEGSVVAIRRGDRPQVLVKDLISVGGVAWSAEGDEVWFTGARSSGSRSLRAVDLNGKERLIASIPGAMTVHDIAPDGSVLISVLNEKVHVVAAAAGSRGMGRELSWLDYSWATDISRDGGNLLVAESGEGGGPHFTTYLRKIDGSAAVKLGEGSEATFSPDGKWALVVKVWPSPSQLQLFPIGPGESRQVTNDSINHTNCNWFPDGRRIIFLGSEPGKGFRVYVQDVNGGVAKVISEAGVFIDKGSVSPDGSFVAGMNAEGSPLLVPVAGGTPVALPALADWIVIRWSADGESLYAMRVQGSMTRIARYNLHTQKLFPVDEIAQPLSFAGAYDVCITPDGKEYAYTYSIRSSDLFLLKGVR